MGNNHGRLGSTWWSALVVWLSIVCSPAVAGDVPLLPVRFGNHPTFDRIVFDWTALVEYKIDQDGRNVIISFDRAAALDEAAFKAGVAAIAASTSVEPDAERLTIRLTLPEGAHLRHFRSETKIVIDVNRGPEKPKPEPSRSKSERQDPPKANAPKTETPPQKADAPPQQAAPARKPISLRPTPEASPVANAATPLPATLQAAATIPTSAALAQPEPASPQRTTPLSNSPVAVELVRTPDGQGLRFAWTEPVGAAVFGRGQYLWIIFDRRAQLDLSRLKKAEELLGSIDVIEPAEGSQSTILRLAPPTGTASAARREGDAWVVDIGRLPRSPDVPASISASNTAEPTETRLLIEVPGVRSVLQIRDPDIGDELVVAPTTAAGSGVDRDRDYQQLRIFATAQGAAIQQRADGLVARPVGSGIEIVNPRGLYVSDLRGEPRARENARAPLLFDFVAWRKKGPDRFNEDRQALHRAIAQAPEDKRNANRLELLRFFFAYGHAEDVLGMARLIEQDDPDLVATAQLRAIRGVSALLIGDIDEAQRQLHHASLNSQPEAALWRGALAMAQGDARTARAQMGRGADLYRNYPAPYSNRLNLWSAEARLFTGDHPGADARIEAVLANKPIASERAQAIYLRGRLLLAKGDREGALATWAELESGPLTPGRTVATLDRIEIQLEDGKITNTDAIAQLERLRFSWRGDEIEFRILTKLGRLYIASGDHRAGLAMLRNAVNLFPKHRETKGIVADISESLAALFMGKDADTMPPISAIALFDEFRDWLPKGARGDDLARNLADRLIAVDLLDRAGELLEQQIKTRLSGEAKARAGARLAFVRLLDRKADAALDALRSSEEPGLDADLMRERRRFEARALADLGRPSEALQQLGGDESNDARILRADIHWRAQNWQGAADALDGLVGMPTSEAKPTDDWMRQALYLTVALSLAEDKDGLTKLDERIGGLMRSGPYKDIYQVVATQPGQIAGDIREIAARVAAATPFTSFLNGYRQRLAAAQRTGS